MTRICSVAKNLLDRVIAGIAYWQLEKLVTASRVLPRLSICGASNDRPYTEKLIANAKH